MISESLFKPHGAGFAELPIPFSLKFASWFQGTLAGVATFFACLAVTQWHFNYDWTWLLSNFDSKSSAILATWITASIVSFAFVWRSAFARSSLGLRKIEGRWVYGGKLPWLRALSTFAFLTACLVWLGQTSAEISSSFPLPKKLVNRLTSVPLTALAPPKTKLYLWNMETALKPEWFKFVRVVLPYEKGLPKRLLPKVYFEDHTTHGLVLEAHGRRPRTYDLQQVVQLFSSEHYSLSSFPLVWMLTKESGLHTASTTASQTLDLFRNEAGSLGVGKEASALPETDPRSDRLALFGEDGSVFQFRCANPCPVLELISRAKVFPEAEASKLRAKWRSDTGYWMASYLEIWSKLQRAGTKTAQIDSNTELSKSDLESLISIYLVSMISLDPRDPEAFFHLGRLAQNRETAFSALRYARDVGLDAARLIELEASVNARF